MRAFDYTSGKLSAHAAGLQWSEEVEAQVDREFAALGLTQAQVDRLLALYAHYMAWAIDPKRLTFWQRIKAALFILKGGR